MFYHILLTFSLAVVLVSGHRYAKSIEAQPRIGYSTNIVHTYPGYNDIQAESSMNVNLQHQPSLVSQKNRGGIKYTQTASNNLNSHHFTRPSHSNQPKSSNLFNVGYNLSFSENSYSPRKKEQRYTHVNNKKFENAEVITGTLKKNEKVRAPNVNADLSPEEYVSNAFLKQKHLNSASTRHTLSPVNKKVTSTKYVAPEREQISKYPSQSSTFTYNTQQNIFKDIIKSTRPDPIQLSPDFETSYNTHSKWKNVNSGSNQYLEQPRESKHTTVVTHMNPNFNHETALKNSESFDFSNAHGEIRIGDSAGSVDNFSEGSEQYSQRVKSYANEQSNANNNVDGNRASDVNNLNIEAHIPKNLRGVKPLPLDTSLLKDPVLTTTLKESPKDDRVLPIHFDIRPIQTIMETELSKINNFAVQRDQYATQQAQNYRYPSQTNYGQALNPVKGGALRYGDYEPASSQTKFRIYGKPEPIDKNQYKVGTNYGKDYGSYEQDIYKIVSMRPPPPVSQSIRY